MCPKVRLGRFSSVFSSCVVFGKRDFVARVKGRIKPPEELAVKGRIGVEGREWKRVVYKRLKAKVEGCIAKVKSRLHHHQFTWKGLENACIHNSLTFSPVYAVAIAAMKIGKPELAKSIALHQKLGQKRREGRLTPIQ